MRLLRTLGVLSALWLAACAAPRPPLTAPPVPDRPRAIAGEAPCPSAFTGTCYPVWFGTNRKPLDPADPAQGFGTEFDERMHFGKRIVRIPSSHRPGELGSPLWKRLLTGVDDRLVLEPARSLDEAGFMRELRAFLGGLEASDRNVLVYIHGFNTSFDEATLRAAQLGHDLKVPGVTAVYSWPSRASLRAYVSDGGAIEQSEEHIATFLVKVSQLVPRGRVHIVAHSMGNRGLLRAMHRATTQAAWRAGTRFGQVFLAAPDVDVALFRQLASVYPQVAEHTTLYVADQDKALAAVAWLGEAVRAGGAPPIVVLPGIDTIRVRGMDLFRLGHSYVAEEPDVLRDIRAQLHRRETLQARQQRYGMPRPDDSGLARGAWVLGQ